MNENKIGREFAVKLDALEKLSERTTLLPPWLFQHDELLKSLETARCLEQKKIINTINYTHFSDGHVFVLLQHLVYKESILLKAIPEPCMGNELALHWLEGDLSELKLANFIFQYLIIDDGQSIILIPATLKKFDADGLRIKLLDTGYALGERKIRRYQCNGVTAELIQSGFSVKGILGDFNTRGFQIKIDVAKSVILNWFNPDQNIMVHLYQNGNSVFSSYCRVIRQIINLEHKDIVVAPIDDAVHRFRKKSFRNPRRQLIPAPTFSFVHPFIGKKMVREVYDIANTGFSVREDDDDSVLLPGMIIPELELAFHGISQIKCAGQVLYRQKEDDKNILCGIAILDMDIDSYSRLTHIISSLLDPHAHLSKAVDLDELWKFFFETDFIYAEKYRHIHAYRKDFKEVYNRLYVDLPEIARHFTYEKNGHIYAHISMFKAYTRTWFVHHHTSKILDGRLTGFRVLKQIVQYFNGIARLPSAKTDYALCYYRPQNEFPDRVFGDFAREFGNLKGSSLDLFSYMNFDRKTNQVPLPDDWSLAKCTMLDIWELERFYMYRSGGLLLDAIGMKNGDMVDDDLEKQYQRLGFVRKCDSYSLNFQGQLHAAFIVEQSIPAFNLSGLTNGIKVLITKPESLEWDVLSRAITILSNPYKYQEIPLLIYPAEYANSQSVACEKQYQLWILNLRDHENDYGEFLEKRFRIKFK
ncbi:MAG: hypothetical protein JXA41_07810 [Deltaproteobacteria bacterium]|nr:hypothetical protein [Deltaproteobacteria bacterium]